MYTQMDWVCQEQTGLFIGPVSDLPASVAATVIHEALPASPPTVVGFMRDLLDKVRSRSTISKTCLIGHRRPAQTGGHAYTPC